MVVKSKRRRGRRKALGVGGWIAVLAVAALVVVGGAAFGLSRIPVTGEREGAVCVLLVDRSASTSAAGPVQKDRALAAIDGCRARRARTSVFVLNGQQVRLLAGRSFALWRPMTKKQSMGEADVASELSAAKQAVSTIYGSPAATGSGGSDILTAVDAAATNLQTQARSDAVTQKYLVVFTDGLQLSTDVSVESFTAESVPSQPLIARAKQLHLTPALAGTQVSFVGVKSGQTAGGQQLPEWFVTRVGEFWQGVVVAGGGRMCAYEPDLQSIPSTC
jgi:hypothetical protein